MKDSSPQYDPDEELRTALAALDLLVIRATVLHRERKLMEMTNVLNRISRVALEGTYCICDISDLAG